MKLTFLGNGACFYPVLHNTSAYFVHGNNLILLDCGETVYERLVYREDLDRFDQIYVLITHLHADHVGSLGSLLSYCACVLKRRIYVVHPKEQICRLLSMMGIADDFYCYRERLTDEIEGLSITPVRVFHVSDMECFGYEIESRDGHIYYSGDAADIPGDILEKFRTGEIQKLYQDTSAHKSDCPSHMYVGDLEKVISWEQRKRVVCIHLDCDWKNGLQQKGFGTIE